MNPVRALAEGGDEWVEVGFEMRGGGWGGQVILFRVVHIDWRGMGFGFGIWGGVPLFLDVAPVRDLTEGNVGWF